MFSNSDTDSGKNQSTQLIEHNFGAFVNLLLYLLVVGYANLQTVHSFIEGLFKNG